MFPLLTNGQWPSRKRKNKLAIFLLISLGGAINWNAGIREVELAFHVFCFRLNKISLVSTSISPFSGVNVVKRESIKASSDITTPVRSLLDIIMAIGESWGRRNLWLCIQHDPKMVLENPDGSHLYYLIHFICSRDWLSGCMAHH